MIPLYCPTIDRRDMMAVLECMVNEQLTVGALTRECVQAFSGYVGCVGGVALRDVRTALDVLFSILSAQAVHTMAVTPFSSFVVMERAREHNIECSLLPLSEETGLPLAPAPSGQALFVSSPLGLLPDTASLKGEHTVLIEEVGEGLGGSCGGRSAGSNGEYVVVSLEARNILTAGGGVLLLGRTKRELLKIESAVAQLSTDSLLSDMNAALSLTQLRRLKEFVARRRTLYLRFRRALPEHVGGLREPRATTYAPMAFPMVVHTPRTEVIKYALRHGVEVHSAFGASILARYSESEGNTAAARALMHHTILAPLYPALTARAVETIEKVIRTLP